MQVLVRPPTAADAEAMGSVHVRAWRAAYSGGLMPDEYLASLSAERRAEMWRTVLSEPSSARAFRFVAEDATGSVVGFASVGPARGEDLATDGEIYSINVDPDSWGAGAGPALLGAARRALQSAGFRRAILWVHPDNGRARRFYEARGWLDEGVERSETVLGVDVAEVRYSLVLD
jgi:ribosomal protein S18 acetylase RimI-like enzyme